MISTICDILYVILHISITALIKEKSAIALRSEEIKKDRPIATASEGGVVNLSQDSFFILSKNKTFFCIQRNRFKNGIVSEIK